MSTAPNTPNTQSTRPSPFSHPSPTPQDPTTTYKALEHYPWHTDTDYLTGLRAILSGPNAPSSQQSPSQSHTQPYSQAQTGQDANALILHARTFYYTRKFSLPIPIDVAAYGEWRSRQPPSELSRLDVGVDPTTVGGGGDGAEGWGGAGMGGDFVPTPEGTPLRPRPEVAGAGRRRAESMGAGGGGPGGRVGQQEPQTAGQAQSLEDQPPPASFQEIMEMIREDKPIPGIKQIPDTVLVGEGTEASKGRRQKPWESGNVGQARPGRRGLFAGGSGG